MENRLIPQLTMLCVALVAAPALGQELISRSSIPDYDQRRSGLPNNGAYYCVPTSYTNMYRYMGTHGMPGVDGSWGTSYADMTQWIFTTGLRMGTDSTKGTRFSNAWDDSTYRINANTSKLVYHFGFGSDADWGVNTIRNNLRMGSIINIGRGKYEWDGNDFDRVGGHMVTLQGYYSDGTGNRELRVRDPADDSADLNSQSTYVTVAKATQNITLDTEDDGVVTHARYTFSGNNNTYYMVDNMHAVLPCFAAWPSSNSDSTTFTLKFPFQLDDEASTNAWPRMFTFTTNDAIVDWQWDMKEMALIYATTTGVIKQVDIFDNTSTTIVTINGTKRIVLGGPFNDLYVHSKATFAPDKLHYVPRKGGFGVVVNVGFAVGGLDYDEFNGGPAVIDSTASVLKRFSRTAGKSTTYAMRTLQTANPHQFPVGALHFKLDHLTGDAIVATEGQSSWVRYHKNNARYDGVKLSYRGATTGLQEIMPGERGLVFVQDGNRLRTLDRNGLPAPSDFDGMTVPTYFKMNRSGRLGLNPMIGPGWEDVAPGPGEP